MKKFLVFLCAISLIFGLAGIASAVPVVYTDETAWLTAVSGSTVLTEDFESSPLGSLTVGTTDIGLFDITIDSNAENQIEIAGSGYINNSIEFHGDIDNDANLILDFSSFELSPIIGFAGEWYSTTTGDLLTVNVNGTIIEFDNYLSGDGGTGFLGVVDTIPFTSISFGREDPTTFGEYFALDNFQLASASVPEPATMLLLGSGLIGLAILGRKKLFK